MKHRKEDEKESHSNKDGHPNLVGEIEIDVTRIETENGLYNIMYKESTQTKSTYMVWEKNQ